MPKLNDPSPVTYSPDKSFITSVYEKNDKFFTLRKFKEISFVDKYTK